MMKLSYFLVLFISGTSLAMNNSYEYTDEIEGSEASEENNQPEYSETDTNKLWQCFFYEQFGEENSGCSGSQVGLIDWHHRFFKHLINSKNPIATKIHGLTKLDPQNLYAWLNRIPTPKHFKMLRDYRRTKGGYCG